MFVDRSEFTAANQVTRVSDHVRMLKEACLRENGRNQIAELFTVDSPVPYSLSHLREALEEDNTSMEEGSGGRQKQGKWFGHFSRLLSRLDSKIADRRYGFMFSPPSETLQYEWLHSLSKRLLGDAMLLPTRVRLDRPSIEPYSATRKFWQEWAEDAPDEAAISSAVEALRAQTRL